jgi:acetylglutamate kinase
MALVVLKLGGRVASAAATRAHELHAAGDAVVVVHGAGPQITAEMEARGITPRFVDGRRVTTPEVLDVVSASLRAVNGEVCRVLGAVAVGLYGDEIGLRAEPLDDLGHVGDPRPSAPAEVLGALAQGRIPVVSPLASGPLNVNADEAAAALAVGLGADRIEFVSDVPGVLLDGAVAERLDVETAERMLSEARFEGGIVPKLLAAVHAARSGVRASIGATEVVA